MTPLQFDEHLYLLPLDVNRPGFTHFIGAWLYRGEATFLVDVGPAATAPVLLKALERMAVSRLDAILLTHIHLDHAGAAAPVAARYPSAPLVCHETAVRHLADPAKLWQGSLEVLGDTARAYGPVDPVPPARLVAANQLRHPAVASVATPGHAPHHVSYAVGDLLFAGEAGGVYIDLPDKHVYLRPATPPRFFLQTHLDSIDTLLKLSVRRLCYGHFGATDQPRRMLQAHREQLLCWSRTISETLAEGEPADVADRCVDRLLRTDPWLAGFGLLSKPVQARERYFLCNSVMGFKGFLASSDRS